MIRRNKLILVIGRKGTGKTYWTARFLDGLGRHVPLVVWDPKADLAGDRATNPIGNVDGRFFRLDDFLRAQAARPAHLGRVVITAHRDEFPRFCQWAMLCGGLWVAVDEINLFCNPTKAPPELLDLFDRGRHHNVSLVCTAQRPASIHRDLSAQADEIRVFRTQEPRDLKWLREYCGEQFARRVSKLGKHRSTVYTG